MSDRNIIEIELPPGKGIFEIELDAWESNASWDEVNMDEFNVAFAVNMDRLASEKRNSNDSSADCGGLALMALIETAENYETESGKGLSLSLGVWDSNDRSYTSIDSSNYDNKEAYTSAVVNNLGAISLRDDGGGARLTTTVSREQAGVGTLIVYDLRGENSSYYTGHTEVITSQQGNNYTTWNGTIGSPPYTRSYSINSLGGQYENGQFRQWRKEGIRGD